jgi:Ni/Co efflux regulator RcnB
MKKMLIATLAAATALTGVMSAEVATAQPYDHHDDRGRHDDHRGGDWDRGHHDDHRGGGDWNRGHGGDHHWRYYGGQYGYNGYRGPWRVGRNYPHWRDNRYVVNDWRTYNLPPPRPGYRYYRADNGDIVMAAIASGMIGLIVGGALAN